MEKVDCHIVHCPTCQTENPDDVEDCRACSSPLPGARDYDRTQLIQQDTVGSSRDAPTADISGLAGVDPELTREFGLHVCRVPTADLEPDSQFGPRYVIKSLLGQGGMGKVYRAYDLELNRTVALKLVRPELAMDPQAMARFRQELLLASKVSHRNILRIHDLGDVGGVKFISMVLVEGHDLHDVIRNNQGPLPFKRALNIALQLCSALDAAHAEGVMHRDLKPRNILLDATDHVYVTDFGLAKSVESESAAMTRTGDFIGTPLYMSPEQIESRAVDCRSDLYSLGLILYEMVTGDLPFSGRSSVQVMHSRMTTAPKDPKLLAPDLPNYFAGVIAKCLARDVAHRYQSAGEIRRDLENGIAPSKTLAQRLPKPSRTWALVAAAMALAAGVTLAIPGIRAKLVPFGVSSDAASGPLYYMAILPFKPLGDHPELKYQAEGVVEALNAKLFPLKQVNLASPNNVERAASAGSLERIAKQLGANLLVQGTVQRGADRLAINVSAWDAKTNSVVWSQQFQCAPDSLLSTEDDIYNALVDRLKLKLSSQEMARGVARATEDSGAYDFYMRGRSLLRGKASVENYQASLTLFQEAITRDPRFARAYAGIAESCFGLHRLTKDSQWGQRGLGAAQQSISLDRDLPDVHLVMGSGYLLTGKISEAISEFKQAVQLAPSSDEAYRRLGNAYSRAHNKELALTNLRKATAINPYSYANYNALGLAENSFGDTAGALKSYQKVIQLQPDYAGGHTNVGSIYFHQGKWPECLKYFKRALELDRSAQSCQNLGVVTLYSGNPAEAVRLLEEAARLGPKNHQNFGNLGDAYAAMGESEKASAAYQEAIDLAFNSWKLNSKDAATLGDLALYYAEKGDSSQAVNFIQRARAIDPKDNTLMYREAVILHLDGKEDQSLSALKASFESGYPARVAANDYAFRALRSHPSFQKLLSAYNKPG